MSVIQVDFEDHVYENVTEETELILRGNGNIDRDFVITERDKPKLLEYFDLFSVEFRNEAGIIHTSRSIDGGLTFTLTDDQSDARLRDLSPLVEDCARQYVLHRWFKSLKMFDLASFYWGEYRTALKKFTQNSTQDPIVQPKYHPYF